MNPKEILKFCLERGLLVDKEVLSVFSETEDIESVKLVIEGIRNQTDRKIITKDLFNRNREQVSKVFCTLPEENQRRLEKLKIRLGLSIEISKEVSTYERGGAVFESNKNPKNTSENKSPAEEGFSDVRVTSANHSLNKKIEVKDFVGYFRARFSEMRDILQERSELNNLVSINKISGNNQRLSLIGIVSDKKVTKNKNMLLEVEDLTGKIRVLVSQSNESLYEKAEEVPLDSVVGFKGSGNKEIVFANDIIFPDSMIHERKKSPVEEFALFTGDLHVGSKLFLKDNFLKFVEYLNGKVPNTPEVRKIKYLFIVGDLIAGIGIYPGQEKELSITDVESQFETAAELLGKIRKDIKIIISPGNHDAIRIMEPQPAFDEKYAWPLYNLKNVYLTSNPAQVNIGAKKGFQGFNVLTYHGYSFHYYSNNIPRLIKEKATHKPDKILHYLLKNRHLAPTHTSTLYYPSARDELIIRNVPDIFVSSHTHKSAVSYYNNILTISSSTWESKTAFQEKMGNEPDFCKVPMFNLKTGAIKLLDFE